MRTLTTAIETLLFVAILSHPSYNLAFYSDIGEAYMCSLYLSFYNKKLEISQLKTELQKPTEKSLKANECCCLLFQGNI